MHKVSVVSAAFLMIFALSAQARPPASARINIREKLGTNKAGLPSAAPAETPASLAPSPAGTVAAPAAGVEAPGKWFKNAGGYQEALEIQKQTGADIFLFFANIDDDNQKGLCNWLETRGFDAGPVRKFLKEVIKVKATIPSNDDTEALAAAFGVKKCPSVYMVHPNGKRMRCNTFTYENKRPELPEPEVLAEQFRSQTSQGVAAAQAAAAAGMATPTVAQPTTPEAAGPTP